MGVGSGPLVGLVYSRLSLPPSTRARPVVPVGSLVGNSSTSTYGFTSVPRVASTDPRGLHQSTEGPSRPRTPPRVD